MSMVVRTNSMAMSANSALNKNNSTVAGNLQKLSTGFRINRAADDASGLAVSEKMKAQIKALDQAGKNAQDGASLIKTAEGYMGEIHDMLNRIVELAEKSANGTFETKTGEKYGDAATDRQAIQDEVDQLTTEIDRIASTANFNQLKLLDGSLDTSTKTTKVFADSDLGTTDATKLYSDQNGTEATKADLAAGATVYTRTANEATYTQLESAPAKTGGTQEAPAYQESDLTGKFIVVDNKKVAATTENTASYTGDWFTQDATTYSYSEVSAENYPQGEETTVRNNPDGKALTLQIGETSASTDKLEVSIMSFKTKDLFSDITEVTTDNTSDAAKTAGFTAAGSAKTINVSSQETASKAAEQVRDVINKVSAQRATLGAMENRLDYTMNNLDTASQNITDANSRIRDTDMAKTMMEYTQGNTLTQAAQAMLAQANQAPSQVLQLLQ